jgi:hypothetical protein
MPVKNGGLNAVNYAGDLAVPISPPRPLGIIESHQSEGQQAYQAGWERVSREMERKTLSLFRHFKIVPSSEDAWARLALALAARHVPGFEIKTPPRVGRPKRDELDGVRFFLTVRRIQNEERIAGRRATAVAACRVLALREAMGTDRKGNPEHIRARTNTLKNRFSTLQRLMEDPPPVRTRKVRQSQ